MHEVISYLSDLIDFIEYVIDLGYTMPPFIWKDSAKMAIG